jgi:hypothetical protein
MGKKNTSKDPTPEEIRREQQEIQKGWSRRDFVKKDRWNRYGQARVEIPQGVKLGRRGSNGEDYEA